MKKFLFGMLGAVVGVTLGIVLGALVYNFFDPPHGCGQIGCWDWVAGSFVGAMIGLVGGPIVTLLLLRRRSVARSAAAGE